MGKRVVHCGEAGAGQAAKICNNMMLGISMIGVCEAFVLAEKLGLSHQALFDVASTSSGQCWSLTNYCPVPGPVPNAPSNNGYKAGFASALMLKDLKLAQEAAAAAGATTPLGAAAAQLFGLHNAWGEGRHGLLRHHPPDPRQAGVGRMASAALRRSAGAAAQCAIAIAPYASSGAACGGSRECGRGPRAGSSIQALVTNSPCSTSSAVARKVTLPGPSLEGSAVAKSIRRSASMRCSAACSRRGPSASRR